MAMSAGSVAAASASRSADPGIEQVGSGVHTVGKWPVGRFDHVDPLERRELVADLQDPIQETGVLDDGDAGFGVTCEVLHLLRRRRVVDADRRGAEELGSGVEPVEVGPVAHHQQHLFTRTDVGGLQPGGGSGHLVGELLQRPDVPAAFVAHRVQRRRCGVGSDEFEEVAWDGTARGSGVDLGDGGQGCQCAHVAIVTRSRLGGNLRRVA